MQDVMAGGQFLPRAGLPLTTLELTRAEREEVLAFLAERPVHTVCMAGLTRDNGVESPHNRGAFYGCRNSEGRLEGVYVHPSERGTGLGRRCLTGLTRGLLLHSTRKICLLANEENPAAHTFYRMCGFRQRGVYDTIVLSTD